MKTIQKNVIPLVLGILIGLTVAYFFLNNRYGGNGPVKKYVMHTASFSSTRESDEWVKHYEKLWNRLMDSVNTDSPKHNYGVPVRFFTIRSQDLLCAMGMDTAWQYKTAYPYVRINIGYSDTLKQLKAFIQPVYGVDLSKGNAGHGLFFTKQGQIINAHGYLVNRNGEIIGKGPGNVKDSLFVGDLNTPCPATCGD